ncbi:unnamed protein product [Calypogeia fissa]
MDECETAILVVGADEELKTYVAKTLALKPEILLPTMGKGTIYGKRSGRAEKAAVGSSGPLEINRTMKFIEIVVNTSPFPKLEADQEEMRKNADSWTQFNRLRELHGKLVAVVCVINATSSLSVYSSSTRFTKSTVWDVPRESGLDLLRYIFDIFAEPMTFLVKLNPPERVSMDIRKEMELELENQGFKNFDVAVLEFGESLDFSLIKINYFPYKPESHGPRGPIKLILFGNTGSGKSTIAQMLVKRKLGPDAKTFGTSSGARGKTDSVEFDSSAKWFVVDTPGLGERQDKGSTITTCDALIKIYLDIEKHHGVFTHFIYVRKKSRLDMLEDETWAWFNWLFGAHVASNFTVVITDSDQQYVAKNSGTLEAKFEKCAHFIGVQFPPIDLADEELEEENEKVRLTSLRQLEDGLAERNRQEVKGLHGRFSTLTLASEQDHLRFFTRSKANTAEKVRIVAEAQVKTLTGKCGQILIRARKNFRVKNLRTKFRGGLDLAGKAIDRVDKKNHVTKNANSGESRDPR